MSTPDTTVADCPVGQVTKELLDKQLFNPEKQKDNSDIQVVVVDESAPQGSSVFAVNSETMRMRRFETGATRDTDTGKLDYEGFISPLVERRFAEFMHRHRTQSDGVLRDSDNWQKGIPLAQYAKSLIRHVFEFWFAHDGYGVHPRSERDPQDIEELLCAIRFNAQGYLFELLKSKEKEKETK